MVSAVIIGLVGKPILFRVLFLVLAVLIWRQIVVIIRIKEVMRMRLKASGSAHSPKTTLEVLHQLQKHRVRVGTQTLSGIGKINPIQLELFAALAVQKPD